ncbi:MAG: hypothetical protein HY661_19355 [Betaproteobacteria bacterium]|nr:hypothetical protein [Betaproteobacteria bacterium]
MQEEQYGTRDRAYSAWHRRLSTRRFVGIEHAQRLAMIDLDAALYVEYDDECKQPLALIETARDVGQPRKAASVTVNLAKRAGVPAYVLLYRPAPKPNPADARCPDIAQFRVRRMWPRPEREWRTLTPAEWAEALLQIRAWSTRRLDREAANDSRF